MKRTQRIAAGLAVAVAALGLGVMTTGAVGADDSTAPDLSYPLTTVVYGNEGEIFELLSADVPSDLVGQTCGVSVSSENNDSVHPDNDLLVASGGGQVVLPDVEAVPGDTVEAGDSLTLGTTITVSVRLGPDGILSEGGTVHLACTASETTTTTTSTPTSSVTSTTLPGAAVEGATAEAGAASATAAAPTFTG